MKTVWIVCVRVHVSVTHSQKLTLGSIWKKKNHQQQFINYDEERLIRVWRFTHCCMHSYKLCFECMCMSRTVCTAIWYLVHIKRYLLVGSPWTWSEVWKETKVAATKSVFHVYFMGEQAIVNRWPIHGEWIEYAKGGWLTRLLFFYLFILIFAYTREQATTTKTPGKIITERLFFHFNYLFKWMTQAFYCRL